MSQDALIMAALKTRLQTILVTGGYQTNIGQRVYIWRTSELGNNEVPAILCQDTEVDHDNGQIMGMTRHSMTVDILVVQNGATVEADARKARADLRKCLHGFETMGGLVNSLTITKSTLEMKQYEDKIAGASAQLLIEYDTARDLI